MIAQKLNWQGVISPGPNARLVSNASSKLPSYSIPNTPLLTKTSIAFLDLVRLPLAAQIITAGTICLTVTSPSPEGIDLAVYSFTFGSTSDHPITIPNVVFGCGHKNGGTFQEFTSGIVGLGGGPLLIVNQLEDSMNGKFSYCLVLLNEQSKPSKINFGSNAVVSGTGVVSTPLITKSPSTFYYLNLEKITIGNQTLEFKASLNVLTQGDADGNIFIDSGITLTLLPPICIPIWNQK
ncbi:hypothetical protein LguiA_002573 [Lonicera macranthoides]